MNYLACAFSLVICDFKMVSHTESGGNHFKKLQMETLLAKQLLSRQLLSRTVYCLSQTQPIRKLLHKSLHQKYGNP